MRDGCDASQCRFKCAERLTSDERQRHFIAFYSLGELRLRWQYLAQHCDRTVPKQNEQLLVKKRRQNNIRYFLYGHKESDSEKCAVFVCKTMFMATFDIGETMVATALLKTDVEGNLIGVDQRAVSNKRRSTKKKPAK